MVRNWERWCRLCAVENNEHISLFDKSDDQHDLVAIIKNHLKITITINDEAPTSACKDCVDFILKMSQFVRRSAQVERSFGALISKKESHDISTQKMLIVKDDDHLLMEAKSTHTKNDKSIITNKSVKAKRPSKTDAIVTNQQDDPFIEQNNEEESDPLLSPHRIREKERGRKHKPDDIKSLLTLTVEKKSKRLRSLATNFNANGYKCKFCASSFKTKAEMEKHINYDHSGGTGNRDKCFDCPFCTKSYPSKRKLKVHELIHRTYEDSTMPRLKKSKATLKDQQNTCKGRGTLFSTKNKFDKHEKDQNSILPFKCLICNEMFKTSLCLRMHEKIHNPPKFICPQCGINLDTNLRLKLHMLIHLKQDEAQRKVIRPTNSRKNPLTPRPFDQDASISIEMTKPKM